MPNQAFHWHDIRQVSLLLAEGAAGRLALSLSLAVTEARPTRRRPSSRLMCPALKSSCWHKLTLLGKQSTASREAGAATTKLDEMQERRTTRCLCCTLRLAPVPCLRKGLLGGSGLGHLASPVQDLVCELAEIPPGLEPAPLRRNLHIGRSLAA